MSMAAIEDEGTGELSGAQRAAIFIMYLDRGVARTLLDQLSTEELREIGMSMSTLDQVQPQLIEGVVNHFIKDLYTATLVPQDGKKYALSVLPELIRDDDRRTRVLGSLRRSLSTDFQRFISEAPPAAVASVIAEEHPQTQAVALHLMGQENAVKVLSKLDEDLQFELTFRMARLADIPEDLADDVEIALRTALQSDSGRRWEVPGMESTAQVLGRMGREAYEPLLDRLYDEDPELSEDLRRRMVTFEDLGGLLDRHMQALLKEVGKDQLTVAMRGASPEIRDLILRNMSSRAAETLADEVELLGPTPRSQINEAQEAVVAVALRLQDDGVLTLSSDDDELV